jgi:hypothetical protein
MIRSTKRSTGPRGDLVSPWKDWSEWQDLNLRPPRPERGALLQFRCFIRAFTAARGPFTTPFDADPVHETVHGDFAPNRPRQSGADASTLGISRRGTDVERKGKTMTDTTPPLADEPDRYTVERHGDGWAIYRGRSNTRHGYNLGYLKECSGDLPAIIEAALNTTAARDARRAARAASSTLAKRRADP